ALLEQLPPEVDVAMVFNPALTSVELLATVCDELHIAYPAGTTSLKALVDALDRYLLDAHARGRRTVLVIDEAQDLSREVLEQIRLLTNLETTREKLLQIILIGQPELRGGRGPAPAGADGALGASGGGGGRAARAGRCRRGAGHDAARVAVGAPRRHDDGAGGRHRQRRVDGAACRGAGAAQAEPGRRAERVRRGCRPDRGLPGAVRALARGLSRHVGRARLRARATGRAALPVPHRHLDRPPPPRPAGDPHARRARRRQALRRRHAPGRRDRDARARRPHADAAAARGGARVGRRLRRALASPRRGDVAAGAG